IGKRMGLEPVYVEGRRVTDQATLELVTMVYGGLVNKAIVAQLQSMNIPAIGLTGADANLMLAQKRAVKEVDYGLVGDLTEEGINQQFLSVLLDQQLIPVVAPLTHDGK